MCPIRPDLFRKIHSVLIGSLMLLIPVSSRAQSGNTSFVFTHLAGPLGGWGNADGLGTNARFKYPNAVAADNTGNLYVADSENNTIRKITPAGVVTTLAGTSGVMGGADGTGPAAQFNSPSGVAVDATYNVYVADPNNRTIRKITPSGVVTTLAGTLGVSGSVDGTGTAAQFSFPIRVAIDSANTLYIVDDSTIRKITPAGVVTTLAGTAGVFGSVDGAGSVALFTGPSGLTIDSSGNVYVADQGNSTIRKISPSGFVTTLAGTTGAGGILDGSGSAALFSDPSDVAVDMTGNIYVADWGNSTIRKITANGTVSTLAGMANHTGSSDGTGSSAQFNNPTGVAVDNTNNIYVADHDNHTIRKITPSGVVTSFAGMAGGSGNTDGPGTAARFYDPTGVAVDGTGNVYVADSFNGTIRKVTPEGVATVFAGGFAYPNGVAVDKTGNVYVANMADDEICKITPDGTGSILAGSPPFGIPAGSADGTGTAAQFNFPVSVAVDSLGNVYVADFYNSTIRKITSNGVVTTLAGSAGQLGSADGTGTAAQFNYPNGVAVDAAGNVYVADQGNSTIRKITPNGVVSTLAGTAGILGSKDGIGPAAQFTYPGSVVLDSAGNLYVGAGNAIRKVTPTGTVSTVAGATNISGSADGIGTNAQFNGPSGLAIDGAGNLYIAESGNNAIRKGVLAGLPLITTQPQSQSVLLGKNAQMSVSASSVLSFTYQWYLNSNVVNGATTNTMSVAGASAVNAGDYTVVVTNAIGNVTSAKATLTVSAAPPPPSGGGAINEWFALGLLALVGARRFSKRKLVFLSH